MVNSHTFVEVSSGIINWPYDPTLTIWPYTFTIWPYTFTIWPYTFIIWPYTFTIWPYTYHTYDPTLIIWPDTYRLQLGENWIFKCHPKQLRPLVNKTIHKKKSSCKEKPSWQSFGVTSPNGVHCQSHYHWGEEEQTRSGWRNKKTSFNVLKRK